jgi:hypothetical protein
MYSEHEFWRKRLGRPKWDWWLGTTPNLLMYCWKCKSLQEISCTGVKRTVAQELPYTALPLNLFLSVYIHPGISSKSLVILLALLWHLGYKCTAVHGDCCNSHSWCQVYLIAALLYCHKPVTEISVTYLSGVGARDIQENNEQKMVPGNHCSLTV